MQDIPYGYCHCGCGGKTTISPQTVRKLGYVAGEPRPYIRNHDKRKTSPEYLEQDLGYETPCWVWQRYVTKKGYGMMRPHGAQRMWNAHIVYYERAKGPVPEGLQLDHLCRNRACVNPDHLEAVTNTENQRRGRKPKLTIEQAREIRSRPLVHGGLGALAREFGVHPHTIRRIRKQPDRVWVDDE